MVNKRNGSDYVDSFIIGDDGSIEFSVDEQYLISSSSRVCFWGVLLRLETESKLKTNQLYIFKDSVSTADYSRLCRLVYKNGSRIKGN